MSAASGVGLAVLGGAVRVSTPFLYVSLGECLTEKSGRVNLGLEGTLVMGAMSGYGLAHLTHSPCLGLTHEEGVRIRVMPYRSRILVNCQRSQLRRRG
jgi:ABC-type uncharacterized transport system permease subunit